MAGNGIPLDIAFMVQSFLGDADRKNSEWVSLNFRHACSTLERLEFRDRLQNVELKLIREKFAQSTIASSPKRILSSGADEVFNDDIEKEIEDFESKHIKIPFHLKEYLRMSIHLDPYLILDILKEYVFMHPLTVLCPISDWSVIKQGEEYLIGEFSNTTGNDTFMFTLKQLENGKCTIFMSIIKTVKYGEDQSTDYSMEKSVEIGTLKRWFNNYGFGWFVNRNIFHYSFHNSLQRNHLDLYQISKNQDSNFTSQHIHNLIKNYKFVFPGVLMGKYWLDLLREKLITLQKLKPDIRKDPRIIEAAVRYNGLNLEFVGKEYHRNEEIVRKAVSENGLALRYASMKLRMNREVVELACRQNKYALKYSLLVEREDPKIIASRLQEYFTLHQNDNFSIETIFPDSEYIQRRLYSFGFEYITPFQIDMIQRCKSEYGSKNILFQAPSFGKTTTSLIIAMERIERFKSIVGCSGVHCLILCPNRELVFLVARVARCLMEDYNIITSHGGHLNDYYFFNHEKYMACTPMEVDFSTKTEPLLKPSVIVSTPGRLADDIRSGLIQLDKVHTIIYEEADTLLNGEYHELKHVMREVEEYNPSCKLMNILLCQTLTERQFFRMNCIFNNDLEYFYKNENYVMFRPITLLKECIDHEIIPIEDLDDERFLEIHSKLLERDLTSDGLLVVFGNRRHIDVANSLLTLHSEMDQSTREHVLIDLNSMRSRTFSTTDINSNALMLVSKMVHTVHQVDFPASEEILSKRIRSALHVTGISKLKLVTIVTSKDQERRILKWLE